MLRIKDIPEDGIVFYDIETDGKYAPYCQLKMIAYQLGINGEPVLVDKGNCATFKGLVKDPNIIKVGFNNINFDDIVLFRHGLFVNPVNRQDLYLALKTIHPTFPSYGLKFLNYVLNIPDANWHEPEFQKDRWLQKHEMTMDEMYMTPSELLEPYCLWDVRETVNAFLAIWEVVQKPEHWKPYTKLELAMAEPLHEMILIGREYIDLRFIRERIRELQTIKDSHVNKVRKWTKNKVSNIASGQQYTDYGEKYLGLKFKKKEETNRSIARKADQLRILSDQEDLNASVDSSKSQGGTHYTSEIEGAALDKAYISVEEDFEKLLREDKKRAAKLFTKEKYDVANIAKMLGYFRAFYKAGIEERRLRRNGNNSQGQNSQFRPITIAECIYERGTSTEYSLFEGVNGDSEVISIPRSYYLSAARTRRFQSSSKFGINWQNQNKKTKVVELVPRGWIGWWLDSTQIENVTHIYYSEDNHRREAYEADPAWNEYVWLCNEIYRSNDNRKVLDSTPSHNPNWSRYKLAKTVKLALNFGMGPSKFSETTGLPYRDAIKMFEEVHKACPAIRSLTNKVKRELEEKGYVEDPFGHRYSGEIDKAYKVLAYWVQGCGTGSIPKAMTIANYETMHSLDSTSPIYSPCIKIPYRKRYSYGVLCGTTHDESAGRISLGLPTRLITAMIGDLLYNMEGKFSKLFDNIPLRAKLSVSVTNAAEAEELDHNKTDFLAKLEKIIWKAKKDYRSCSQ
jgi:hypothetical protein